MKKLKKLLLSIIMAIIAILIVGAVGTVKATSAGPLYLGIVTLRNSGYGYKQADKIVWKIAQYDSTTDITADLSKTIYCIKAGPGFGSSDMSTGGTQTISTYTQKFNLKDTSSIDATYSSVLPTGENYNKLLWVLDHLYVMPQPGTDNTENRNAFLANAIPNEEYESLTDDDIDVVQQLAIWYFTNPTGDYHYNSIELSTNSTKNDANSEYKTYEDLYGSEGWDRQDAVSALYDYYITNAQANYTSTNVTTKPVELVSSNAQIQIIGNDYVAGPYTINQLLNVDYEIKATYTDIDGTTTITPSLGAKASNGNVVVTSSSLKELVGQEFYLMIPVSSNISGIKMTITSSYKTRTATYWSVENSPSTEQPVVIVDETPFTFSENTSIVVPKPFDLSLRKFITGINSETITNREPQPDVTALKAGAATTATYTHPKTPVKVQIGDIVTYTIRVYNEGRTDGYVEEITDHLPPNLEFIVDDATNIQYGWRLASSTDLKTVKTTYLSEANETTDGENKIAAFNGTTLAYKDVKIRCKVIATAEMPSKITNIADITAFTDGNGDAVVDRDSYAADVILPTGTELENYRDAEINRGETYIPGQQDDDDFEKLVIKQLDLSLRKFITGVGNQEITSRVPNPDVTALKAGTATTATYNHPKTPIKVEVGDTVIYTIRVYNEGEIDGYVEEITDHLPDQLEFLPNDPINQTYGWVMYDSTGNVTTDATQAKTIKTDYLSKNKEKSENANKIVAFNGETLAYKYVKVACKVVLTAPMPTKITNIAEITAFTDGNGNIVKDKDSQAGNVEVPSDLPGYKDSELSEDYVPGQQDDDDFEKIMIKTFDLSLRKFITGLNDSQITSRIPIPNVTALKAGTATTATYNHPKTPVSVEVGKTVEYTIRVYNEGDVDGYVNEITDHLPSQLKFLPDNPVNQKYGWTMFDENGQATTEASKAKIIKTAYWSKENEQVTGANKLVAFNGQSLDYREVKVVCQVVSTVPMPKKITNIAEITAFTNGNGVAVTDRDSKAGNVQMPSDLPGYKDSEISKNYVPGQQDDDDFEKLIIAEFDLSLRKFITAVNTTEITTRIPKVDVTPLKDGSKTATYTHPKDPVLVSNGNIVTYTIRVYNEGEVNGYAQEVKDDIPEGLEFLPTHETNLEYRWVMLDKDGNETTDASKAVSISTDYLSKAQEKTPGSNLLKAFDATTMDTLSCKDVKVAFRVVEPATSDRIIINQAQISKDSDENEKDVNDRDSTPDEWNEGEDDQDIEKIKVQYFDLSLRKWVTQAIVIEDGNETITETGHKAEDDPEAIAKVDLKKSKIDKVTVKFRYKIRVTNEGTIAGYVKEIKDYIPDGLKFVAEDNPLWVAIDDKTITTDQAKDILLHPGESTEVEVLLTWINDEDNMGVMDNWAEISKDYNEFESPDVDSTPDNNKKGEDDIDDAPVMVTIQTGQMKVYATITLIVLTIITTGVVLIKKFVL